VKLQKATQGALFALLELARNPEEQISTAEIADRCGISANHLAKVLRDLTRVGLVESVRGAGGGYRFRGNAKRITLYEVISLFEDIANGTGRPDSGDASEIGQAVGQVMNEINEIAVATLKSITLTTLLKIMDRDIAMRQAGTTPTGASPTGKSRPSVLAAKH
jgi:Rrf2 family transcriptional regulator, nitric oxide-sensitive transcriptional repressor